MKIIHHLLDFLLFLSYNMSEKKLLTHNLCSERMIKLKKPIIATVLLLIVVLILALMLFQTGKESKPTKTPVTTPTASTISVPDETPEPTPEPTPDPRNEEPVVREEIAKMLRDAKELINEGLDDDASRILRDLRTRTLTDAEQKELDALQSSMVKISD